MPEVDELQREIQNLRKELRGEGKPWYAKSPFKEILTHAAAVTTAVGIGLVVHKWTGEPITIEAKNVPAAEPSAASVVIPSTLADSVYLIELEDAGAVVVNDPKPTAAPAEAPPKLAAAPAVKRKKPVEEQVLEEKLAYAPAPAATAVSVPTATAAAKAAKKPVVETSEGW